MFQAHNRPCFSHDELLKNFHSLIPMVKDFMHGNVQSTSPGGPTMERSNRRNTISILHRSCLYTFLCAAPKQATGVTMASKYLKRSRIATFLLTKKGSVCKKKRFRRSLKMMCQIWGVIASTCCAKHASQPFMCRATVKDFNYLSISKRQLRSDFVIELSIFLFSPRSSVVPLRPNMSPVRLTKFLFPQTFSQKEEYRQRISNPRVCACHLENPYQHCQLSDASTQALLPKHTKQPRLNTHPCRTPP